MENQIVNMVQIIYVIVVIAFVALSYSFTRQRPKRHKPVNKPPKFIHSEFYYSVYQSPKVNGSKSLTLVSEGNRIDELGYQIYKSHTADLDTIDILIRDNKTGEIMKIVIGGDSESMIGVSHPELGHIGYLRFETVSII